VICSFRVPGGNPQYVYRYIVVVKVGKPTERSKPGNRGKRDSQILLMQYLNRVHFDTPMTPLELEIYHQMRNVIGIDPAFYEYIFTIDADTVRATTLVFVLYSDRLYPFRRSLPTL
jgi:hypothetical protein